MPREARSRKASQGVISGAEEDVTERLSRACSGATHQGPIVVGGPRLALRTLRLRTSSSSLGRLGGKKRARPMSMPFDAGAVHEDVAGLIFFLSRGQNRAFSGREVTRCAALRM